MITKLLSTAVKLYLRSQVSQVEDLQVKISGKNRQIITGYIPQVFLSCKKGIYQGLHLREIEVNGDNIAVNLPEVLKKKPLKLLEPIIVAVKLGLDGNDLFNSLDSELLQSGLTDIWKIILESEREVLRDFPLVGFNIEWNNIAIANQELTFSGTYQDNTNKEKKLILSTGVFLCNSHTLCLSPLKIANDSDSIAELIEKVEIDLGKDVYLEKLVVASQQILCSGKITVNN
ncbi:MAG: DUF2993 domain-containing protein [Pleurocapsa sp.]